MHVCNYYCHHPYHAINALFSIPVSEVSYEKILAEMRRQGQQVLEIERVIPVTEVVDLEAWLHSYEDGKNHTLDPGDNYGAVIIARYPEECLDAVS